MKSIVKQITLIVFFFFLLINTKVNAQGEFKINVDISAGNFTFVGNNAGTDITVYDQANLGGPPLLTLTGVNSQITINQSAFTDPSVDDVQIWYSNTISVINFNGNGNVQRIQSIVEWGTATFTTLNFFNGVNLDIEAAAGAPTIGANANFLRLFRNCNNLVDAANTLGTWDTANVTNMQEAFFDADGLVSSNLGNWDVGNVTNFQNMFGSTTLFNDATIENWNIGENTGTNAITMNAMFSSTSAFNQNLNGWERTAGTNGGTDPGSTMAYVNNMTNMFFNAVVFNGAIGDWDVGRVTTFNQMFYRTGTTAFNNGDASGVIGTGMQGWNIGANLTTETINMNFMFRNSDQFNQDLSNWDVSKVTIFNSMFRDTNLFTGAGLNSWVIGGANTNNISMIEMFHDANQFNSPLSGWESNPGSTMAYVTNMTNMFFSTGSFNQAIDNWDVGRVTSFNQMFYLASIFNNGDAAGEIGTGMQNWNIGANLTTETINMNRMFRQAAQFNQDLSNWDVTKVTTFREMFFQATAFTGDGKVEFDAGNEQVTSGLSNWKISGTNTNAVVMNSMFTICPNFNEPLATWETDPGSTMAYVALTNNMFNGAVAFNQPLGDWDVGRVTNFSAMFANMNAFDDQAPSINTWNIGENTGTTAIPMNSMFQNSNAFNSPLASWERAPGTLGVGDPGSTLAFVSTTNSMFEAADIFNQPLGNWNLGRVTDFGEMFWRSSGVTAFNNGDAVGVIGTGMQSWNIGANLTGTQSISMFRMFRQSQVFNQNLSGWDVRRVNNFQETFWTTTVFTGLGLRDWQISGSNTFPITMQNMFGNAQAFQEPLATWETAAGSTTGHVTNMFSMFNNADMFNHPLGDWDVGRVTNFGEMFQSTAIFDDPAPSINNWNISENNQPTAVTVQSMFQSSLAFNSDLTGWETNANSTMAFVNSLSEMFWASNFNNAVNTWDVGRVTDFLRTFRDSDFNQPINDWNIGENHTANIRMQEMFFSNTAFNQPVNNWTVNQVTNFQNMFGNASGFDQSLAAWTPVGGTNFVAMLDSSGLSVANYDATLISWAQQDLVDARTLGANGLEFCAAEPFRANLVTPVVDGGQGWTIGGDALGCAPGNVSGAGTLLYWVSAGAHIGADGDPVDEWRDISGDGRIFNQATAANQPTFLNNTTDMVNFNPLMQFDGTDDFVEGFDFNQLSDVQQLNNEPRTNLPITGRSASSELLVNPGATNEITFGAANSVLGNNFNQNNSNPIGGSWRPANLPTENANTTEYLQLDLGEIVPLSNIRTRGERNNSQGDNYVTSYTVEVSTNGSTFTQVDGVFTGNADRTNVIQNEFSANTPAQYVRIFPQTWNGTPALNVGVGTNGYPGVSSFVLAVENTRQNNVTQSLNNIDANNLLHISATDGSGNATVDHSFEGDGSVALSAVSPTISDLPFLINYSVDRNGDAILYRNGEVVATDATPANYSVLGIAHLGGLPTNEYFNGKIGEANLFGEVLNEDQRKRINTYFAIKYNIPILHNFIYEDEVTATVETVWDVTANATYNNDVFGLALDNNQGLNQRVSSSRNNDNVVTAATINDFSSLNSAPARNALQGVSAFVIMGNDDGGATFSPTGAPNKFHVLNRKWYAQVTGSAQPLFFEFDVANTTFDIDTPPQTTDYFFVKDDNNNGDLSDDTPILMTNTSGDLWSTSAALTVADGQIFTLAVSFIPNPGGVATDLALWLKADVGLDEADGAAVDSWVDQSITSNNASETTNQPNFRSNSNDNINFNPVVEFNGIDDRLVGGTLDLSSNSSFISVVKPADVSVDRAYINTRPTAGIEGTFIGHSAAGNIFMSSDSGNLAPGLSGGTVLINNQPILHAITSNNTAHNMSLNGTVDATANVDGSNMQVHPYRLGFDIPNNSFFEGDIAEVINYSNDVSNSDLQKIESYLAIKYGIDLDNDTDYVDSNGNVLWDVASNGNYLFNTFGIGRDDASGLNQIVSKSANAGQLLTVALDKDFTATNNDAVSRPTGFGADLEFVLFSNNNGANTPIATELPSGFDERIANEWKVTRHGTDATDDLHFKFDGFDGVAGRWHLVRSTTPNFETGVTTDLGALDANGEITVTNAQLPSGNFTLARSFVNIEFETAAASDDENAGGNLPNLLIEGTLNFDTNIDVVINAASTATPGTDYTFGNANALPQTLTVTVPAGTYTAASPIALGSLNMTLLDESYATLSNPTFFEESFVAPFTGVYELMLSAETFTGGAADPTAWVRVGTTSGVLPDGSGDIFDGKTDIADRIRAAAPAKKYSISLTAGTNYYITTGAGGGSTLEGTSIKIIGANFSIIGDTTFEPHETIDLSLSNAQFGLALADVTGGALIDNHVYTITNDDTATITIAADTDALETTANRAFTLTMSAQAYADIDVSYTLTGTAANPADYTDTSTVLGTATIAAGSSSTTIDLTVVDDSSIELTETVIATLTTATNDPLVTANTTAATLNILDADTAAATISVASPVDGTEGTSNVAFTVSLDNGLTNNTGTAITGTVALTGTATNGTDYTDVTSFSIADGSNSVTITVPVIEDTEVEVDETIIATISAPSLGTINTAVATATILDDDAAALTISIGSPVDATEGSGDISYVVSLDGGVTNATGSAITGTLALTGTATNGTDYTDVTTFSIADGASSATITVSVANDTEVEISETVIATISAPSLGAINTASATANITDDDAAALTISIASPVDATEGTSDISYTVSLDAGVSNNTGSAITGTLALTGTATNGTDYTDVTSFAIADGESTVTITVSVTDDTGVEVDETLIASITAPSVGTVNTTASSATATIIDDDTATISIAADANTDESISSRVFNVSMSQIVDTNVEVNYILTGSALNGTDYIDNSPVTGTITIPAGSVVASIDLTVIDDKIVEGDETIIATLTALTNNIDVTANTTPATLNIIDDDQINVSVIEDTDNTESVENREFLVAINNATDVDIVLAYTFSGTATISDDYIDINNGSVTIPAGATVESINLSIINDKDAEEDEQITISLSSQMSGINFDNTSATMTVIDDDSCTIPVEAMVSDIQITSVDLDWSMPNSVFVEGFQWDIFEAGDDPIVATAVVSGMTASGETKVNDAGVLIKDTAYDFYVRAICSDTSMSPYSTPIAFVTLADNDDDGIPDDTDSDDDNDGIPDEEDGEPFTPYDPNGDDDGDGILNDTEDTDRDGNPYNDDCDNDGTPNILDTDSCGVIAAEGFTPNGDGINDTWVVRGLNSSPNNIVNVYNRRGHQVFSARDYQSDWGGFYKQNTTRLPPGSYFYSIELGDGSPPIQGWLFINY